MSEQNTADNWRLEDTGDTLDKWKLQEAEQTQVSAWQLQSGQPSDANWQPVEYERQPTRRGSWVLPLLVGVALIAVFSYGVWIGLGTLGIDMGDLGINSFLPSLQTEPTPTVAAAVVPIGETTPAAEIAATVAPTTTTDAVAETAPPTPIPSPTPAPLLVTEQIVRITNQYGVNARREPSVDGELIQVLEQGAEYLVIEERADGWVQIAMSATEQAWVSAEFVEIRAEEVLLEAANQRRAALSLPLLEDATAQQPTAEQLAALNAAATATAQTITGTQTLTATQPVTGVQPITAPGAAVTGAEITGTVNITAGLNARSTPVTNTLPIELLGGGVVITVTGRTADGNWLQARSDENAEIWVFSEYIDLAVAVDSLPVATPGVVPALPGATTAVTTTTSLTTTTAPTDTAGQSGEEPTASVSSLSGANARLAPDRNAESFEVIAYNVILPVVGRTANDEWLQVDYQGQSVWVLVSTVSLTVDLDTLPVVTP